jgi:hypothetical protein
LPYSFTAKLTDWGQHHNGRFNQRRAINKALGISRQQHPRVTNANSPITGNPEVILKSFYAITGVLLGLVAETQNYVWVMLITYVPAHLVAGSSFGWFPYSTLAFGISYFVSQAKRKRQLVLQS